MGIIPKIDINIPVEVGQRLQHEGSVLNLRYIPSYFSKTVKVNIWSFFKPYSFDSVISPNKEQIRGINCGFEPFKIASYTELPVRMDGGMNGWVYKKPTGGKHDPLRLGDYRGYFTDAKPMVQNFYIPEKVSNQYEANMVSSTAIVNQRDEKSVSLLDLGSLSEYYPSVYLVHERGGQSRVFFGKMPLSKDGFNVDIQTGDLIGGSWTAYPFFAKTNKGGEDNEFYTIPNVYPRELNVIESLDNLYVQAQYKYEEGTTNIISLMFKFTFINGTGGSTTNNIVCLSAEKDDINVETAVREYSEPLRDFNVSSGQTFKYPYDVNGEEWAEISIEKFSKDVVKWVVVSIGSGRIIESTNILQQARIML